MENNIEELEKLLYEKEREVKQIKDKIERIKRKVDLPDLVGKCFMNNDFQYIKVEKVSWLDKFIGTIILKGKVVGVLRQLIGITYVLSNNDTVIYNDESMTVIDESEFNEVLEKAIKAMRD